MPKASLSRSVRPSLFELESRTLPSFYGNQLFPLDNPWNQKVTNAPVAVNSAAIIARIGTDRLHPDFGNPATDGDMYGIPVNIADASTPRYTVLFPPGGYGNESDHVSMPIPANAVIEGDDPGGPASPVGRGDSHLIVYDRSANILYETYLTARPNESTFPSYGSTPGPAHTLGSWGAYSMSVWNLNTNDFRALGWTSADAAGLPILPGLVRPDEALPASPGAVPIIDHAIRFTVQATRDSYVYPASHEASSNSASNLPRMGERFRLKSSFVIPGNWAPEAKAIAQAMKDYGMIVADNGSDMYFQGTPSTSWNMSNILVMQNAIRATDFEVVDLTPAITGLSVTTGHPNGGTAVTISGFNFSGAAGNLHVSFGATPATAFTVLSDLQILAYAPPHAEGVVDVRVQSGSNQPEANGGTIFFGYGTSPIVSADRFTYSFAVPPSPLPPTIPGTSPPGAPTSPAGSAPPSGTAPNGPGGSHRPNGFALGSAAGSPAKVLLTNGDGSERRSITPFEPNFTGGVRVATGDFNGDGVPDVVVGTGPGRATRVRVLDGRDGAELFAFDPFEAQFTGGVFVACGDLTGDGVPDLAVTPDEGGGPRVRILRGGDFAVVADFFGIDDPNFRGGARAAIGDLNGDGVADLIVAAGFGGGPRVAGYDGRTLSTPSPLKLFADFLVFEEGLRNGVYVAAGDLDGDGWAELVVGGGPGGGPRVSAFDARLLLTQNAHERNLDFFAGAVTERSGVRVTAADLNGDGISDVVTGAGSVRGYDGAKLDRGDFTGEFSLDGVNGAFVG